MNGAPCTLTTIGHDKAGEVVGFTAATCGGPGAQVVATGAEQRGPLGTVVAADDALDYAVIKFDPAKISAIADFDGFVINGIGPDPGLGQAVCTQGGATGQGCGSITVPGVKPLTLTAAVPAWQPGDNGAPVTVDGQLVGMTRRGYTIVGFPPPVPAPLVFTHIGFTLFSAILNDANAKGGPGAGFTPI
jgi:hypothetical protein